MALFRLTSESTHMVTKFVSKRYSEKMVFHASNNAMMIVTSVKVNGYTGNNGPKQFETTKTIFFRQTRKEKQAQSAHAHTTHQRHQTINNYNVLVFDHNDDDDDDDSVGDGGYHQVPGCDDSRGTQAPISTCAVRPTEH